MFFYNTEMSLMREGDRMVVGSGSKVARDGKLEYLLSANKARAVYREPWSCGASRAHDRREMQNMEGRKKRAIRRNRDSEVR